MEPQKGLINVSNRLSIPEDELEFTHSRSSGPGGQNVNKVSTRVTLRFDVAHSPSLSEEEKRHLFQRLSTRINKKGVLWIAAQQSRSQSANRDLALARFAAMLREALKRPRRRIKTRIPRPVKEQRLAEKKHRSRLKEQRSERDQGD